MSSKGVAGKFRSTHVLAVLVAIGSCGPASAAVSTPVVRPATDWLSVVVATPQGGFRQGNPNAKVKLLEFGSLSCPHCAAFARESVPLLRAKYVATGRVCYEYRPFLNNGVDFAPELLVRCQPPAAGMKLVDAFYDQQPMWIMPFTKPLPDDVQKRLGVLPPARQITAFAAAGGLDAFVRTRGVTRAAFDACTSDTEGIAKLQEIRDDAITHYGLTSVPTFAINGQPLAGVKTWPQLQSAIDAAL